MLTFVTNRKTPVSVIEAWWEKKISLVHHSNSKVLQEKDIVSIFQFTTMYEHTFPVLANHLGRYKATTQVKWAANLMIADDRFNLPQGFVSVCVG